MAADRIENIKKITEKQFDELIHHLSDNGYACIAPVVKDNAIIYDEITSVSHLLRGWTDEQEKAYYRIKKTDTDTFFNFTVGPYSWKKFLFPPALKLWEAKRDGKQFVINDNLNKKNKYAFIGVRACELNAIFIQDKVFDNGSFKDTYYSEIRENILIIAVNCTKSNQTCFCTSMSTGPKAKSGFDIVLTEVCEKNLHYFLLETGSEKGKNILQNISFSGASESEIKRADEILSQVSMNMKRALDKNAIIEVLKDSFDDNHWDEIAKRCLSCANCTLVCPTCFCNNVEDTTNLTGEIAERWRYWDSCFNLNFSQVAGGNFRASPKARYRQWLTHKLSNWYEQFGNSGCVGCGRCITWCPVGIDITEEAEYFLNNKVNKT